MAPLRKSRATWRTLTTAFAVAAIVYAVSTRQSHGRFLGVPFEFRVPTVRRFRERLWNADDPRIFTPQVFGVGWTVNALQLLRLLRGQRHALDTDPNDREGS